MTAAGKYLAQYAAAEAGLADAVHRSYDHVLVVPVYDEDPAFLGRFLTASESVAGGCLAIVVVNAADAAPARVHRQNAALVAALRRRLDRRQTLSLAPPAHLGSVAGHLDLLLVDRSAPPWRLPRGDGVGLARRIGCDLALALHERGRIAAPWIHTSDADVALPAGYFHALATSDGVAAAYPFWHQTGADRDGIALSIYEVSLRYYVLGLASARSPWAFHTLGSAIAVRPEAYALVRGVPRRRGGEDFYFLNKLAKLGAIARPDVAPLRILQRRSDRVPFGTGPAMARIATKLARGETIAFYHPAGFRFLAAWQHALDNLALAAAPDNPIDTAAGLVGRSDSALLRQALAGIGAADAIDRARASTTTTGAFARCLAHWFDAFRTVKFIHALRDIALSTRPWHLALREAPFLSGATLPAGADAAELETLRLELLARERAMLRIGGALGESFSAGEIPI